MLIVIGTLLFIYILIQTSSANQKRNLQKAKDAYWQRERKANSTRKVDLSNLNYITIPVDSLPFAEPAEEELTTLQNNIKNLAKAPILNLTGLSNTDLKLTYGVANLTFLTQCDNNYTLLVQNLSKWGSYLYDHNKWNEAVTVLEFGIRCKSDISKNYILLAQLYKTMEVPEKIDDLIQSAQALDSLTKENILKSLKEIKMSYYL